MSIDILVILLFVTAWPLLPSFHGDTIWEIRIDINTLPCVK